MRCPAADSVVEKKKKTEKAIRNTATPQHRNTATPQHRDTFDFCLNG
jgi:hypothetical protein